MLHLILRIFIAAAALIFAAYMVPGIYVAGIYSAIIAAIVLGILNAIVKPILIIFTLPINIITLGLFTFVINAALFMFAASFLEGFSVVGFLPALIGSLVVSIITTIGYKLI